MSEIRTGSKPAVGPPAAEVPPNAPEAPAAFALLVGVSIRIPFEKADCSLRNFSWFSNRTAVTALLNGEDLSEEFQEKARTIFESALRSKVTEIKEALIAQYDEAYEARLVEEVQEIKSALEERVDSYLEYVAEEWITENQLCVENGLRSEMTESFLSGMKELFEAHYVSIPEDKYDVLESCLLYTSPSPRD